MKKIIFLFTIFIGLTLLNSNKIDAFTEVHNLNSDEQTLIASEILYSSDGSYIISNLYESDQTNSALIMSSTYSLFLV